MKKNAKLKISKKNKKNPILEFVGVQVLQERATKEKYLT